MPLLGILHNTFTLPFLYGGGRVQTLNNMKTKISHDCKDELNQVQLRATPARLAVMKLLEHINTPMDMNMIFTSLKKEDVKTDFATVYRIINSFTDRGITKKISFHEGKFRYELASKPEHHHLICTSCGTIEDFPECVITQFETSIKKKTGFKVESHSLEFFGICLNCQTNKN